MSLHTTKTIGQQMSERTEVSEILNLYALHVTASTQVYSACILKLDEIILFSHTS